MQTLTTRNPLKQGLQKTKVVVEVRIKCRFVKMITDDPTSAQNNPNPQHEIEMHKKYA